MNILWLSWKDSNHPLAGGAETVSTNIMQRLVRDGHAVRLITASYPNSLPKETIQGIEIFRTGGKYSVYMKAIHLYRQQMKEWPDLIVDEMNTIPFGVTFFTKKRAVLFTYQLARKVWFYQMSFPLSLFGFLLEPLYLFLLSRRYTTVLTESESTRRDLAHFGFRPEHVSTFRVGMELKPTIKLTEKTVSNQIIFLGALRPMKQALDAVKAFEQARDTNNLLTLRLAGDDSANYAKKIKQYVENSRHKEAISILGRVPLSKKLELLNQADIILVTSVKEGWGLIVTEANSQGTPAIVYDTDGLRDSVRHNQTGIVVPYRNTNAMAAAINNLLKDRKTYNNLRKQAWEWSKEYTFENSYQDFCRILDIK